VARLEAALRAVKRVASLGDASVVLLGALFHLVAEVQLELVLTNRAMLIDNHDPRFLLSKCVQADVMAPQFGPNSR
jgi:hypothetical protein